LKWKIQRYGLILLWLILYLVYTSLFGVRLRAWNWNLPGHCYNTHKISLPTASHPRVDGIYIGLTCLYLFASLWIASGVMIPLLAAYSRSERPLFNFLTKRFGLMKLYGDYKEISVLCIATIQLPLHLYSLVALRASNEKLLKSGATEQEWGFGQIVAVVLLGTNILGLLNGVQGTFVCFYNTTRGIMIVQIVTLTPLQIIASGRNR
jgi:hypothetical protein